MRSVRSSIGSVVVGMCLAALFGCGGGDTSTPKGAAKTMVEAMKKGDAATVKSVTVGGDPKFVDMMVAMVSSNQQLHDAAVAKFGADGNSIGEGKMLDVDKQLDDAEVKENGDTATIKTKDSPEPMTLKKVDGQWKVDLSQMPQMPGKDDPSMQPMFNAMMEANKQLAADISAGKYKTAAEAQQAGREKLMAAAMSMQKSTPK